MRVKSLTHYWHGLGKEAIQKALRMGMHFNPREIEIPIGDLERAYISIGKSKMQLKSFSHPTHKIMLAYGKDIRPNPVARRGPS